MKKTLLHILPLLWLALSCTREQEIEVSEAPQEEQQTVEQAFTPGVATVEFDDEMTALVEEALAGGSLKTKSYLLDETLEALGVAALERVFPDAGEYEPLHRKEGLHRFYAVRFPAQTPVTKAVSDLQDIPGVLQVAPVRKIYPRASFNDPNLNRQWHLVNTRYPEYDIHVQEVWEQYTTGDPSVIVAVQDEAVDFRHEDLFANMWTDGNGHYGYNPILDSYSITASGPYAIGHGTHVAGIIGAVNNNGKGVCGIAGGDAAAGKSGVRIMSIALLATTTEEMIASGKDTDDIASSRAFTWSADHGAVISQNSWGWEADGILDGNQDGRVSQAELNFFKSLTINHMPSVKAGIDYFLKYAGCDTEGNQREDSPMKGGIVLFAAGNEGDMGVDYDPICDYEPVIAVGGTDQNGKSSYFSQYGDWVDIAAPGGGSSSIWSTVPKAQSQTGYAGGGWVGTSMACPHVSGVAALIVSYFGGPGFTAERCKEILFGGLGEVVGGSKPVGRRLNALASFEFGINQGGGTDPEPPTPNREPVISLEKSMVSVRAHQRVTLTLTYSDPDGDPLTVTCEPGSKALKYNQQEGTILIVGNQDEPGVYQATFTVTDPKGLSASATLQYALFPNHAPQVVRQMENQLRHALNATFSLPVQDIFADEDGETPAIQATCDRTDLLQALVFDGMLQLTPRSYGLAEVTLTATDALNASTSQTFRVAIKDSSKKMELSPNVTPDYTYIWVETESLVPIDLKIYSATGALVLHQQERGSLFEMPQVDVMDLAPGVYTVSATYDGTTHKAQLIKY